MSKKTRAADLLIAARRRLIAHQCACLRCRCELIFWQMMTDAERKIVQDAVDAKIMEREANGVFGTSNSDTSIATAEYLRAK